LKDPADVLWIEWNIHGLFMDYLWNIGIFCGKTWIYSLWEWLSMVVYAKKIYFGWIYWNILVGVLMAGIVIWDSYMPKMG